MKSKAVEEGGREEWKGVQWSLLDGVFGKSLHFLVNIKYVFKNIQ